MVLQKEYVLLTSSAISINITVSESTKKTLQITSCITTMLVENVSYLRWYKVIDLKITVYKRKTLYRVCSIDQQNGSVKICIYAINEGMYHLKVIAQDWYLLHSRFKRLPCICFNEHNVKENQSLMFIMYTINF